MENNYTNLENMCISSVETNQTKKKAILFIAICTVVPYLFGQFISAVFDSSVTVATINLFNHSISFITNATSIILVTAMGYLLTRQRSDAFHFIGICALGNTLSGIVKSILSLILEIIFPANKTDAETHVIVQTVIAVISLITTVAFTCLLYNKIIGGNAITPVSTQDYSKVKKNMIFAYITVFAVALFFSLIIGIVVTVLSSMTDFDVYIIYSTSTNTFNVITLALNIFIIFGFGYKPKKSRIDGIRFASAYYFPQFFSTGITSLLNMVLTYIVDIYKSDNSNFSPQAGIFMSIASIVISVLSAVLSIVLIFTALKYFFPIDQIDTYDYIPQPFDNETTMQNELTCKDAELTDYTENHENIQEASPVTETEKNENFEI